MSPSPRLAGAPPRLTAPPARPLPPSRVSELGAHLLRVGDADGLPVASDGLPEELLPIIEILPLQRLAWQVAIDRGFGPDRPRGLSKVTQPL